MFPRVLGHKRGSSITKNDITKVRVAKSVIVYNV